KHDAPDVGAPCEGRVAPNDSYEVLAEKSEGYKRQCAYTKDNQHQKVSGNRNSPYEKVIAHQHAQSDPRASRLGEYQARNRRDNTHRAEANGRAYEVREKQEDENDDRSGGPQLIFMQEYPTPQAVMKVSELIIPLMYSIFRKSNRHYHAREY